MKRFAPLLAFGSLLAACGDATGPAGTAPVELRVATSVGTLASPSLSAAPSGAVGLPTDGGTYQITDLQFVVSEFELEGTETCIVEDEDGEIENEECEFEGGPFLVDVPLDGSPLSLATGDIAEGTYLILEFEVEDLEHDAEDAEDQIEQEQIAAILNQLRGTYPDLPQGASMVLSGEFVPDSGPAEPFTVYFEAEVEIERLIDPPLVVPDDTALTIVVDPIAWFSGIDLLELDGQLVEFEVEIEDGFAQIEIGD